MKVFHTRSLCKASLELLSFIGNPSSSQANHLWFVCVCGAQLGGGGGRGCTGEAYSVHQEGERFGFGMMCFHTACGMGLEMNCPRLPNVASSELVPEEPTGVFL